MRAPISIIIPTLNAQHTLPDCLSALMEGVRAELIYEVVVTDGGSTDATHEIAEAWGAEFVSGPASRGGQLARGCVQARGAWLFVLHADTQLRPGWTEGVRAHLSTKDAGWCRLRFDQGGAVVAAWANLRSRFGLPYGDQGLLLPRALYQTVGGYKDIPLMEDVSMARALRGRLRAMDATAVTSAEKYRQQGWIRRGARNLLTLLRYFAGADPDSLARAYRSAK
jgi:rSAM/selenodomain-associated transferase 2